MSKKPQEPPRETPEQREQRRAMVSPPPPRFGTLYLPGEMRHRAEAAEARVAELERELAAERENVKFLRGLIEGVPITGTFPPVKWVDPPPAG